MARDDAARALLRDCGAVYSAGFPMTEDLRSDQTITHYREAIAQKKYVHMYFAKQVALWRRVRARIGMTGDVWSVGAGPMLDLFGFFWDEPAPEDRRIVACDVLPWNHVRELASSRELAAALVPGHTYRDGVAVPSPARLPQCVDCEGLDLAALPSSDVPNGATVFFPFVLNHVIGRNGTAGEEARAELRTWVRDVLDRGGRVVVADLHLERAPEFWRDAQAVFQTQLVAKQYDFGGGIGELGGLYQDEVRNRRTHPAMAKATVLILQGESGSFM
jgi:hypothetical protein